MGCMLLACCSDIVPLLFGHGAVEDEDNWEFFLTGFLDAFKETALLQGRVGLLTDRHPGLLAAARRVFCDLSNVHLGNCTKHIEVCAALCESCNVVEGLYHGCTCLG